MIAPELTWYEVGSKQIRSTKDFRGQKLILDFLGTNCGWCWKKIPRLQHWARSLKESKVAVAAISCFGTVADMERIVGDRRHFLSDVMFGAEPLAWDFFSTIAYTQFHIRGTPVLFLIDENGLIRASSYADGGAGYESFLKNADLAGVPLLVLQTEIDDIEVKVEDGELVLQQRHGDL